MAELPYQVYEPEAAGFSANPELLAQALRARQAQSQVEGLAPRLAELAQRSQYQTPQGISSGGQFVAASPLAFIGEMLSSGTANMKRDELEAQAKALRGTAAEGEGVKQQQALELKQQQTEAARQETLAGAKTTAARDAFLQKEKLKAAALRKPAEEAALLPDGHWKRHITSVSGQKEVDKARDKLGNVERVYGAAQELDEADIATLDKGIWDVILTGAPASSQEYLKQFRNLSPRAKKFVTMLDQQSAIIRHAISGAAVSKTELPFTNSFLPAATGIPFADRIARVGLIADDANALLHNRVTGSAMDLEDSQIFNGVQHYEGGFDAYREAQLEGAAKQKADEARGFTLEEKLPPGELPDIDIYDENISIEQLRELARKGEQGG